MNKEKFITKEMLQAIKNINRKYGLVLESLSQKYGSEGIVEMKISLRLTDRRKN